MATQRRDVLAEQEQHPSSSSVVADVEARAGAKTTSSTRGGQHHSSSGFDDGGNASSFTSLKALCYLLIFIASFVFYEDLLVARVAVRKHFFGLESGVGAATLLGEDEPESDLIDTRTGKLDLNLRHISKRKHERVETIEEHNEKELIDRVGLDLSLIHI